MFQGEGGNSEDGVSKLEGDVEGRSVLYNGYNGTE